MNLSILLNAISKEKIKLLKAFLSAISIYYGMKLTKWLFNYFNKIRVVNKIPGLPMTLFLGNIDKFVVEQSASFNGYLSCTNPFKDRSFCRLWIGTKPIISFIRCDHLEVLVETSKHAKKSQDYGFLAPWLGDGLLLSYGDKWHSRRKLITPTFHYDILKDYFNIMNEQCDIMIDEIKKEIETNNLVKLAPFIGCCALDIICETAMGHSINSQRDKNSEYLIALEQLMKKLVKRIRTPLYWSDFIFNFTKDGIIYKESLKVVHNFTMNVIRKRLEGFELNQESSCNKNKRVAFLDLLLKSHLENPTEITIEDIRDEVDTFMFEGHDTTSSGILWTCYCLARHPDIQKKVHEELDKVVGNSNRTLTIDDLNELKYLELVIKESMRMYPPVPMVSRDATEDCVLDGYKIQKGTKLHIFIYQIHRDERYFPEPEKFIPERFLPENTQNRHPYAYLPFSAGRRNCIGQRFAFIEEKLLIANIFRNFEMKCQQSLDDLIPDANLILRTVKPILFKTQNRLID